MTAQLTNTTPAMALAQLLIDNNHAVTTPATRWQIFVGHMPDSNTENDEILAVFNSLGEDSGRLMTGEIINHFGFQLRSRALKDSTGWQKLNAITNFLSTVSAVQVSVIAAEGNQTRTTVIEFKNIRCRSILPIGNAEDISHRHSHVMNGTMSIRQISSTLS